MLKVFDDDTMVWSWWLFGKTSKTESVEIVKTRPVVVRVHDQGQDCLTLTHSLKKEWYRKSLIYNEKYS